MTAVELLLDTARAEIGYLEKKTNAQLGEKTANAGRNNYTKYARDMDKTDVFNGRKQGFDWCAVFVVWCFAKAFSVDKAVAMLGLPRKSLAAGVRYFANYFKQKGRFRTSSPQPGDVIFYYNSDRTGWQHTGVVESVKSGKVYTIEGNTSGASGVVWNGGGVARKSYALTYSRIAGYGRPDWAAADKAPAPTKPDKEDDEMLTYEQFTEYMERYRRELQAKPGSGWSEADRDWAVSAGLFEGSGKNKDNYMWQDFLTREQAAVLFHRGAEKTDKT